MPEHQEAPEPTELVYLPRPSWGPAFLALGTALLINGIYGEGFLVRGWVYMIIGAIVALVAVRTMIGGAVRDFFRLPRRQRVRSAVLPAASVKQPPRQG